MRNRKTTAILLAAALALSLGGISVFAGEAVKTEATADPLIPTEIQESDSSQEPSVSQDIPRPKPTESPAPQEGADQSGGEAEEAAPDPAGVVSFDSLESRVSQGSLQYLILEEKVAWAQAVDYDKLGEDLKKGLNSLAEAKWQMHTGASNIQTGNPVLDGALQGVVSLSTSPAAQSLQAQYDTMREKFDDLQSGKLQSDAADGVRQLRDAQNSILMVTQGMYIQLSELQATQESLDRSLAALDRQIQELELRYQLGQISALQLQQAKTGRDTLVSKQESLDMSARTLTMNLAAMLGSDLTGELKLTNLPQVSAQELADMDLEADLTAAKSASFELYNAKKTLEDARKTYKDAADEYNYNEKKYQFVQAKHDLQGAEYTYDSVLQSFELKFRTLYEQVKDYAQVLAAARTALAAEESACAVDRLKYEQGTISKNALLTAEDDLAAARDTVNTAARNLFSSYNNYRWAVDHGILN